MSERVMTGAARPKPGPRPRANSPQTRRAQTQRAHGSVKRRTAHPPRPQERSKPRRAVREPVEREPIDPALNRRLWFVIAVIGCVAAVVALLEAPTFEARNAQISGAARTSEGAILDGLAITEDQALLTYDTEGAAGRLRELPWVQNVSVVRQWPSTVRVVVREHAVAATVGNPSGTSWVVMGEDRRALEVRPTPPAGVPLIVAPDVVLGQVEIGESVEGIERAYTIARDVPGQLAPWIANWSVDTEGNVWANLVGSAHVNMGPVGDYPTQFVSLASILASDVSRTCLSVIDLTIADTPVLHRDASCVLASRAAQ